jgi:hypothetical protein
MDYKPDEYTLVQVYVAAAAGLLPSRDLYTVGLNGKYKAKCIGISFADRATDATQNKLIRISSDCFRSINGNLPYSIALASRAEHNMGNPQGEWPFILDVVGGRLDLTLTSSTAYTGVGANTFDFAILTLKVCPIPNTGF